MTIRELLFRADPYKDFPVREDATLNGWNSRHAKLGELIRELKPSLIVEVGSWLGASALYMAENTDAQIVCLDTWLGAQEMWSDRADDYRYGALKIENGYPTIYRDFMSNIVKAGKQDQITPMPMPSSIGLRLLDAWGIQPDLIYVDGSHRFEDVLSDIKLSFALRPIVIAGDDYWSWPDVRRAVDKWIPDAHKDQGGFWWVNCRNRVSSAAIE